MCVFLLEIIHDLLIGFPINNIISLSLCLSEANSNDAFTSCAALHLSTTTVLKVGARVQGAAMRDLGGHCLHLYYNCPRKDSGAQSYRRQV